jgi:hypothetical protein
MRAGGWLLVRWLGGGALAALAVGPLAGVRRPRLAHVLRASGTVLGASALLCARPRLAHVLRASGIILGAAALLSGVVVAGVQASGGDLAVGSATSWSSLGSTNASSASVALSDGLDGTYWQAGGTAAGEWYRFDLGLSQYVGSYYVLQYGPASGSYFLESSDDGANWSVRASVGASVLGASGVVGATARYWRIITSAVTNPQWLVLTVNLWAAAGPSQSVGPSPSASPCPSGTGCLSVGLSEVDRGRLDSLVAVLVSGFGLTVMLLVALVIRSVFGG